MNKLDNIVESIDETTYELDLKMKINILKKVKQRQYKKSGVMIIKSIAALLVLSFLTFTFIPNNPVNAFMKQVFSFIPGIGVTVDDTGYQVEKVLNGVIRFEDDKNYVDLYTAYIQGDYLQISVQTDLYIVEKGNDSDFINLMNHMYIIIDGEKIKASSISSSTELFNASYFLTKEQKEAPLFNLSFESDSITIPFMLEKVKSSDNPLDIGNYVEIDNMMIFANLKRDENSCEVIISQSVPDNYQSISYEWFEHENSLFTQGVYVVDSNENKYQLIEKEVDKNRYKNTFYFNIPAEAIGLKLVIPQVLYSIELDEKVMVKLPGEDEKLNINHLIETKTHVIELISITYVSEKAGNGNLDTEKESLLIDMKTKNMSDDVIIRRIMPLFETKKNIFSDYMTASQSVYGEVWVDQEGSVISEYEKMKAKDKVQMTFEVEFAYIKDIVINLD